MFNMSHIKRIFNIKIMDILIKVNSRLQKWAFILTSFKKFHSWIALSYHCFYLKSKAATMVRTAVTGAKAFFVEV